MNAAALCLRAHAMLAEGRANDALAGIQRYLGEHSECARVLCLKALALHELERDPEAIEVLRRAENLAPRHHLPVFLQALVWYDTQQWERAARAVGCARLLSHEENFVAAGLERLILHAGGERPAAPAAFASCPSMYNGFVAPRVLTVLEAQVFRDREALALVPKYWARLDDARPPPRPRSAATWAPFLCLRVPVLCFMRILRRPTMPYAAEEAYLRGDLAAARHVVVHSIPAAGRLAEQYREYAALLSLDLEDYQGCLAHLPPRGEDRDPLREFVRGVCQFHMGKWKKAAALFSDAAAHPMAHYFAGLCRVALGETTAARKAFALEFQRGDIGIAERIMVACKILEGGPRTAGDTASP